MESPFGTAVRGFRESGPRIVRLDPLLLVATVALLFCSIYTLYTATGDDVEGSPLFYVIRQSIYAVVGIGLMLAIARFDYSRLRELKLGIYGVMIATIFLVFVVGAAARGSQRWIELPFFRFQPSELGKLLLIVALSAFLIDRLRRGSERETTSRIMLLAIVPAMLVVVQPDLGSAMVYLVIAVTILFMAGTRWTHFAALGGIAVLAMSLVLVAAPAAGVELLKPYQVDRLTAFLDRTDNPREQGYQLNQSITAIGSGEKTGRGPEAASQTKLDFLPEHHTDFVFSVVGEQFGFAGAAFVLSLFALLIWRGLRIMTMSKNLYGTLIAAGITAMLMFQVFINVGMTIGIMPITGIPLPLMSYGGSSVIVTLLGIGLLQSIHVHARELAAAKTAL